MTHTAWPEPISNHDASPARGLLVASTIALSGFMACAMAQTQNTTTNYAYDAQGNLTTVTNPTRQVTTQIFDALNRRVQSIQPPPTTGVESPVIQTVYDARS